MNNNKPINGLILSNIKSKVEPKDLFENLDQIKDIIKNPSLVVAYLDYKVMIGEYSNGSFVFYNEGSSAILNEEKIEITDIQRLRVFNREEELMLWRSNGILKGRHRKDNEGNLTWVIENHQVLNVKEHNDFHFFDFLTCERGIEAWLFFDEGKNKYKAKTRNYIGFNEIYQATYVDCRFVEFTFGEDNISLKV